MLACGSEFTTVEILIFSSPEIVHLELEHFIFYWNILSSPHIMAAVNKILAQKKSLVSTRLKYTLVTKKITGVGGFYFHAAFQI